MHKGNFFRKQWAATALYAIMGIGALTGCGSQEDAVSADQAVESTAKESTADAAEEGMAEESAALQDSETAEDIVIFTTNDIHGTVVGDDESTIGIVQTAAIAASVPNALLVDAGDAMQGGSFATVSEGEDVIELMNVAGYDVMALGNHDFDYGQDRLVSNLEHAQFPVISANVEKDGQLLTDGNTVVDVNGKKIGFIGLTTVTTATSTNASQLEGITFTDEIGALKKQIAEVKDDTDAIILVTHLGDNPLAAKYTSEMLLEGLTDDELAEVTAVVDGHSHTVEQGDSDVDGFEVPIVQTGCYSTAVGQITLHFDEENHVTAEGMVLDYATAMAYPLTAEGEAAAAETSAALEKIQASQEEILDEVICTTDTPLWGGYIYYDYAEPRIVETNYGDFVTDAFAEAAAAYAEQENLDYPVIALENGGGISATLPYGQVTRGDILNAFNHGNTIEVLTVTPADLYGAVEAGLVTTGQDADGYLERERVSGSFLQCSGFSYTYDPAGEEGGKVVTMTLDDGTKLDRADDSTLLLSANNNYVSTFFANAVKLGEVGGEDLVVENYLLKQTENGSKNLSMPVTAGRIQIANDVSPSTYEITVPILDNGSRNADTPQTVADKTVHLRIDDKEAAEYTSDADGNITLTLEKGPHTLYLEEAADHQPVYANNYSGSGTVCTADGFYRLGFYVE